MDQVDAPRSLYLHVPFCPQICPYCDFHKMLRSPGLVEAYVRRLVEEAAELSVRWPGRLDTVYLGGGTPSHLSDAELDTVLDAIRRGWGGLGQVETTLEADPLTFGPERLAHWREQGISRLSIGLQSTQDPVLRLLGRGHDRAAGLLAVEQALEAGFQTSVDLITTVPGQDVAADLRAVASLGAQHLSVYTLTIEDHTPFARRGLQVDDERAADAYQLTDEVLSERGYERYEVSNHALPGHRAAHNQVYWRGLAFMALGPGAAALEPPGADDPPGTVAVRLQNATIKGWLAGEAATRSAQDGLGFLLERLMTGLRTVDGVDLRELQAATGVDPHTAFPRSLAEHLDQGRLVLEGQRLRASDDGLLLLNAVLRGFFREVGR